jgi:hypothetical protein
MLYENRNMFKLPQSNNRLGGWDVFSLGIPPVQAGNSILVSADHFKNNTV